jgi:hypothetical protein
MKVKAFCSVCNTEREYEIQEGDQISCPACGNNLSLSQIEPEKGAEDVERKEDRGTEGGNGGAESGGETEKPGASETIEAETGSGPDSPGEGQ